MQTTTEEKYIEMPEKYTRRELNALYREIPLKDTTSRQLRKYFNAMARFYGIIPLRKAYEIVSEQCPKLVSKGEFFAFAEIARHECEDYCILKDTELYTDITSTGRLDWKLIDPMLLFNDAGELSKVDRGQRGKPYYIPPKNELLAYKDMDYWEPTQQAEKLRDFLSRELHMGAQETEDAFADILMFTRCLDGGMEIIMEILRQNGADFGKNALDEFLAVYQDFHNNTRMQINRGYTPMELKALMEREERFPQVVNLGSNIQKRPTGGTKSPDEVRRGLTNNNAVRVNAPEKAQTAVKKTKVGRNDPCPCGSGKKYKKCCGR